MIPPSLHLILYGSFCSISIGKLFIATAIPGIIMALIYMSYIGVRFLLHPSLGPKRKAMTLRIFRELISSLRDIWPVLLIMGTIFGGIYGGFMTATESAAVSGVEAILLAAIFGRLNFTVLKEAAFKALEITAMCFLIVVSANMLGTSLALLRIPAQLCAIIAASGLDPLVIWGLVIVMYLILGCLMCVISMMFVTLPIVFPLMMGLGFDPIWLGVVLGITLETGLLTPPAGMNLFVIQGVSKVPFMEVVKGSFPFFLLMLCNIALVTFVPQLATWLPSTMMRR
ncbi:C4-dicarboxylate TRAP transporter large permease protein DctM [subsurface metagenome]